MRIPAGKNLPMKIEQVVTDLIVICLVFLYNTI